MMNITIKVCGMRDPDNIRKVEQLGVDMMGFIFYPKSPRYVHEVPRYLPTQTRRVGVFVDETKENILALSNRFSLDYIQLHGNESPQYCRSLRACHLRLIKAFSISSAADVSHAHAYEGLCDYYLFDTHTPQRGGSGNQFDWSLLQTYQGSTPFLLSGGIDPHSVEAIKDFSHPRMAGLDLNSRFETLPAMKDVERIQQFLQEII